jgi:hypothetical protein
MSLPTEVRFHSRQMPASLCSEGRPGPLLCDLLCDCRWSRLYCNCMEVRSFPIAILQRNYIMSFLADAVQWHKWATILTGCAQSAISALSCSAASDMRRIMVWSLLRGAWIVHETVNPACTPVSMARRRSPEVFVHFAQDGNGPTTKESLSTFAAQRWTPLSISLPSEEPFFCLFTVTMRWQVD